MKIKIMENFKILEKFTHVNSKYYDRYTATTLMDSPDFYLGLVSRIQEIIGSEESQNVSDTSELKKALKEKLEHYKGHLGHPDFSSRIEQNACECLVRELKYLDSIVEYNE